MNQKDNTMTRKVDTYEYENLETCIQTEQVHQRLQKYLLIKHFINGTAEKFYMNKFIDFKVHTVGKSILNLGNHVLILGFK